MGGKTIMSHDHYGDQVQGGEMEERETCRKVQGLGREGDLKR